VLSSLLSGLGLGLSLIVAIGAQNLFVLRQGVRREHVLAVVVVCALSDATLIALGVSGIGLALEALPWLIDVVRWAGAAFLLGYGLLAARRAWRPAPDAMSVENTEPTHPARADAGAPASSAGSAAVGTMTRTRSAWAVVATCLALTWLNPHVYLDTVVLLGTVSTQFPGGQMAFAAGAATASFLFFFSLGYGARWLAPLFARASAWRVLDALIGVMMLGLAAGLIAG
jgi:L-lysine exporter family protein LysE/ArgO